MKPIDTGFISGDDICTIFAEQENIDDIIASKRLIDSLFQELAQQPNEETFAAMEEARTIAANLSEHRMFTNTGALFTSLGSSDEED